MTTTFRPYTPDQSLLLPPDLREWLIPPPCSLPSDALIEDKSMGQQ